MTRCPGQDMRFWTAEDIFDVRCPYCDNEIEFWKDEPFRLCSSCQKEVRNPRIDLGCAKWCKYSEQCLGRSVGQHLAAEPVVGKLMALIETYVADAPQKRTQAMEVYRIADMLLTAEGGDPCCIKAGALLAGALCDDPAPLNVAKEMLAETALSEEETGKICGLLKIVLVGRKIETTEAEVLHDALLLSTPDFEDKSLFTESGEMIFTLRRKKESEKNQTDDKAEK